MLSAFVMLVNKKACLILQQYVEYYMNKGVLGIMKTVSHTVWEYEAAPVRPHQTEKQDKLHEALQVPVVPPSLIDMCGLIQIHYVLKVCVVLILTVDTPCM